MVMPSQHCYLDLFIFCFLCKMCCECHTLFWAGTNIQGFHHHCHCHHSTANIFPGLCSSTPCWENYFLNFIHVVICLVYLFLQETVVSRNCGRHSDFIPIGRIYGLFLIFYLLLSFTSYKDAKYEK